MGEPGRRTQPPSLRRNGRIHARDVMPAVDGTRSPPREVCAVSRAVAELVSLRRGGADRVGGARRPLVTMR